MSLYKRSGVWHYDFGWYGQRYRGSTKQTTQSKARKVESMLLAQLRSNGNAALISRSPLLKVFAKEFLVWIDQHDSLAYKTKKYYHDGWQLLSTTSLASMRMDQITNHQTETIKFPGSSANANRALRTLRRTLSKAREGKLIASVPSIKLRKEQGRSLLIDDQTETELLGYMHGKARDAFIIMRDAGMRNDEVFRMRVEFINWQNLYYHNPSGKTKRAKRCVPLSDRVLGILGTRSAGRREGWVFPSHRAACGHLTTINKAFELARQKAGLPKGIVPYCARHTFGTRVYEATGNLATLMEVMGHAHVSTAMRYQHPGLEQIRAAVNGANTSQNTSQRLQ